MTIEKTGTINWVWIFPYYYQQQDLRNKWGSLCADQNIDANTDLPLKYHDWIVGLGVWIMFYSRKTLLKEAIDVFTQCWTDNHVHFLFQIDEFKIRRIIHCTPFLFSTMLVNSEIVMIGLHISRYNNLVGVILQGTAFSNICRHDIVIICMFLFSISMVGGILTSHATHSSRRWGSDRSQMISSNPVDNVVVGTVYFSLNSLSIFNPSMILTIKLGKILDVEHLISRHFSGT